MTIPEKLPPALWRPETIKTILSDEDDERLARAFEIENQSIDDFIKRLNEALEDIVRKK
jgi:predicted DNA-binding protein YlxM (UPF0122 family)